MIDGEIVNKLIKRCLHCGTSLSQLRATKQAGCSHCYDIFDDEIKRLTGDFSLIGNGFSTDKDEILLKDRLKEALSAENYELAALLRDELAGIIKDELQE
jgi:protein-arginine kinase activator protein McsA